MKCRILYMTKCLQFKTMFTYNNFHEDIFISELHSDLTNLPNMSHLSNKMFRTYTFMNTFVYECNIL